MLQKITIAGVPLTPAEPGELIPALQDRARRRAASVVCFCNVHTFTEARRNELVLRVFRDATFVLPDGAPVAWLIRRYGWQQVRRSCGPDTMEMLFSSPDGVDLTHFFWGGLHGSGERLVHALQARYPRLQIAGHREPSMNPLDPDELDSLAKELGTLQPDFVWVGIGAPRQEQACHALAAKFPAVYGAVGAAFDFLSGTKARAPLWMRKTGLEWLFRLGSEPRRLTGRYLKTNLMFIGLVIRLFFARLYPNGSHDQESV